MHNTETYLERSRMRISIAKEFLDNLKNKVGDLLVKAYLYGSTVRKSCRELSDIDLILIIKNDTKLVSEVENIKKELEIKYGLEISPYFHFENDLLSGKIRSKISEYDFFIFSLSDILSKPHLSYPEEFTHIAYL